jgi:hypothetical protein
LGKWCWSRTIIWYQDLKEKNWATSILQVIRWYICVLVSSATHSVNMDFACGKGLVCGWAGPNELYKCKLIATNINEYHSSNETCFEKVYHHIFCRAWYECGKSKTVVAFQPTSNV